MDGLDKYANWLEDLCRNVADQQPEKIGVVLMNPDGTVMTGYWGETWPADKAVMAHHVHVDAVMDIVMANAKQIVAAAEEQEEDE